MKKTLGCVTKLSIVLLLVSIVSGCQGKVDQVKNMVWDADKSLTLGKALDNYKYFEKREWSAKKTDNGKEYIEFIGTLEPSTRLKDIDSEMSSISTKITRTKRIVDKYSPMLASGDINAVAYIQYGCIKEQDSDEAKCISDAVKTLRASYYVLPTSEIDQAKSKIEYYKGEIENDQKRIASFNEEISYYKNNNRIQVVYQFLIQQDKTISIEYGGYQINKTEKSINFNNLLQVLSEIYKNKPIMKYIH